MCNDSTPVNTGAPVTVTMRVHHGDYRKTETATAATVREALQEIIKTSMGRGYGPTLGEPKFDRMVTELEATGKASLGWAEYLALRPESEGWHVASTGNHQGLIISETGENIAVAYDKANAPLIAAAPKLLAALEAFLEPYGNTAANLFAPEHAVKLAAARAAIAEAKGQL